MYVATKEPSNPVAFSDLFFTGPYDLTVASNVSRVRGIACVVISIIFFYFSMKSWTLSGDVQGLLKHHNHLNWLMWCQRIKKIPPLTICYKQLGFMSLQSCIIFLPDMLRPSLFVLGIIRHYLFTSNSV